MSKDLPFRMIASACVWIQHLSLRCLSSINMLFLFWVVVIGGAAAAHFLGFSSIDCLAIHFWRSPFPTFVAKDNKHSGLFQPIRFVFLLIVPITRLFRWQSLVYELWTRRRRRDQDLKWTVEIGPHPRPRNAIRLTAGENWTAFSFIRDVDEENRGKFELAHAKMEILW